MKYYCWFQCINPDCRETYSIFETVYRAAPATASWM